MKLEGSDLGFYGPEVRKKEELIKLSYLILSSKWRRLGARKGLGNEHEFLIWSLNASMEYTPKEGYKALCNRENGENPGGGRKCGDSNVLQNHAFLFSY